MFELVVSSWVNCMRGRGHKVTGVGGGRLGLSYPPRFFFGLSREGSHAVAGGGFGRNFRGMVGWGPVRIDVGEWNLVYLGSVMEVEFQHWSYLVFLCCLRFGGGKGKQYYQSQEIEQFYLVSSKCESMLTGRSEWMPSYSSHKFYIY